jgi:hypothetical protein
MRDGIHRSKWFVRLPFGRYHREFGHHPTFSMSHSRILFPALNLRSVLPETAC